MDINSFTNTVISPLQKFYSVIHSVELLHARQLASEGLQLSDSADDKVDEDGMDM